jgi:hypothetical protein
LSNTIAKLLGISEREMATRVARLEHICAKAGVDARLTADIIAGIRKYSKTIGLDPADTTVDELYFGLQKQARMLEDEFKKAAKFTSETDSPAVVEKLSKLANGYFKNDIMWLPKSSVMKKVLELVIPKKTLKLLGYRSISSYLKREDPFELYVIAKHVEDDSWAHQIEARMRRLLPKDFEEQSVKSIVISQKHAQKMRVHSEIFKGLILPCEQMGLVIIFSDMPSKQPGSVLLGFVLLLMALQRTSYLASFQHVYLADNGLDFMPKLLEIKLPSKMVSVGGLNVSWQSLYRILSEGYGSRLESDFLVTDFRWNSLESILTTIVPSAEVWIGSHILGVQSREGILSLHLLDVLANLVQKRSIAQSHSKYLKDSLINEFEYRYAREDAFKRHITSELGQESIICGMII